MFFSLKMFIIELKLFPLYLCLLILFLSLFLLLPILTPWECKQKILDHWNAKPALPLVSQQLILQSPMSCCSRRGERGGNKDEAASFFSRDIGLILVASSLELTGYLKFSFCVLPFGSDIGPLSSEASYHGTISKIEQIQYTSIPVQ